MLNGAIQIWNYFLNTWIYFITICNNWNSHKYWHDPKRRKKVMFKATRSSRCYARLPLAPTEVYGALRATMALLWASVCLWVCASVCVSLVSVCLCVCPLHCGSLYFYKVRVKYPYIYLFGILVMRKLQ